MDCIRGLYRLSSTSLPYDFYLSAVMGAYVAQRSPDRKDRFAVSSPFARALQARRSFRPPRHSLAFSVRENHRSAPAPASSAHARPRTRVTTLGQRPRSEDTPSHGTRDRRTVRRTRTRPLHSGGNIHGIIHETKRSFEPNPCE